MFSLVSEIEYFTFPPVVKRLRSDGRIELAEVDQLARHGIDVDQLELNECGRSTVRCILRFDGNLMDRSACLSC